MKKKMLGVLLAVAMVMGSTSPTFSTSAATAMVPPMVKTIEDIQNVETMSVTFVADETEKVIPVVAEERGGFLFGVAQNFSNDFLSLTLTLFEDSDCTISCGNSLYLFSDKASTNGNFAVPSGGTYYLKVTLDRQADSEEAMSFSLSSMFLSSEDRELEQKVFVCTFDDSAEEAKDTSYTMEVDKAGVLAIGIASLEEEKIGNFYLSLFDENGNSINENFSVWENSDVSSLFSTTSSVGVFAVNAGHYTVRASGIENYMIGYDFIEVKEKSGCSKKKAVKLKTGQTRKGIVAETDSVEREDWYKIVLPKKSKFALQIGSISNSNLEFKIVDSKGVVVDGSVAELQTTGYKISTKGKWKKGTYYLSVKKTEPGSGYYTVTLKR